MKYILARLKFYPLSSKKNDGFSIAEVAIGGAILAAIAGAAIILFNQYISASTSAKLKDELSAIITADSETLRDAANGLWPCSSSCPPGTLAYNPPTANGACVPLAAAAASENPLFTATSTQINIPGESTSAANSITISRSITHQGNIIVARYTSSAPTSIDYISYILPASQGWCP